MKLRLSRHMRIGGRPSRVSSDQRAWKIGQAISGSRAPSSQSRKREMPVGTGIGSEYSLDIVRSAKMMLLALPIWLSKLAVYVFCE